MIQATGTAVAGAAGVEDSLVVLLLQGVRPDVKQADMIAADRTVSLPAEEMGVVAAEAVVVVVVVGDEGT
jgi:hypothetical protein